jgi:hypothetical protein
MDGGCGRCSEWVERFRLLAESGKITVNSNNCKQKRTWSVASKSVFFFENSCSKRHIALLYTQKNNHGTVLISELSVLLSTSSLYGCMFVAIAC